MPRPIQYGQRENFAAPGKVQSKVQAPKEKEVESSHRELTEMILRNIGKPDDLQEVQIKRLHDESHYRVNIFRVIKEKRTMSNSYYVMLVEDGIVASPPMDRIYYDDLLEAIVPTT
jgi:hypothetical protein